MKRIALATVALIALFASAGAQNVPLPKQPQSINGAYNATPPTCVSGKGCWLQTDINGNLLVAGSFSSTVTGFLPSLSYNTCTATASSCASTALPTNTGSIVLFNSGTTTVSCTLAAGAATATASELQIPASSGLPLATTGYDHYACIDQSGSASNVVVASGGSGLATGWGGGGSGGSGSTNYALETGGNLATIAAATGPTSWAAGTLGAMANYGTSPGAVLVPGMNAFITNLAALGTAANQATIISSLSTIDTDIKATGNVQGTVASGASVTGNPLLGGGRAQSAEPTAVTDGQAVAAAYTLSGKAIVLPYANKENFVQGTTSAMTGTTSTSLIAGVASNNLYITHLSCVNSHATVGTFVSIQDGTGGTIIDTLAAAAVYGGHSNTYPVPLKVPTAGNGIFVADVTTGANVICSAQGYSGK